MGSGKRPTFEYVFPILGGIALFSDPSIVRDFWVALGGAWTALLTAWHCGWRRVK